jgi:hypothetical protein
MSQCTGLRLAGASNSGHWGLSLLGVSRPPLQISYLLRILPHGRPLCTFGSRVPPIAFLGGILVGIGRAAAV